MDEWLHIVIRQLILYSLPVLVSLTLVGLFEAFCFKRTLPHAFFAVGWKGAWLPLLASIALHRGVIPALPRALACGAGAAAIRLGAHSLICIIGFLLFAWSLQHPPVAGLPPLHHWWAKVLMYFNLCMVFMHLLPMPGMLLGECLRPCFQQHRFPVLNSLQERVAAMNKDWLLWLWVVLAASPLPDAILGVYGIFPLYAKIATVAAALAQ